MNDTHNYSPKKIATGRMIKALGSLLHVYFEGDIRQGEVCMVRLGGELL